VINHASIPADEPERVARVIAELWRSEYFPFVFPGSFVVLAGDEHGTEIEVQPRGMELTAGPAEVHIKTNKVPSANSETHLNITTPLSFEEISTIAKREGWTARICDRMAFNVIELWLENKFMLELMTEAELKRYRDSMKLENWRAYAKIAPQDVPNLKDRWGV